MGSANLAIDNICMSLDLMKHHSVCLYIEVNARLEAPLWPARDRKMDIATGDHGPTDSKNNHKRASATYHTAHSEPLQFSNTPFPSISPPYFSVEGVQPIPLLYCIPRLYSKTQAQLPCGCLFPIIPMFRFKRRS